MFDYVTQSISRSLALDLAEDDEDDENRSGDEDDEDDEDHEDDFLSH